MQNLYLLRNFKGLRLYFCIVALNLIEYVSYAKTEKYSYPQGARSLAMKCHATARKSKILQIISKYCPTLFLLTMNSAKSHKTCSWIHNVQNQNMGTSHPMHKHLYYQTAPKKTNWIMFNFLNGSVNIEPSIYSKDLFQVTSKYPCTWHYS